MNERSSTQSNNEVLDPFMKKIMVIATITICSLGAGFIFLVPHPEETQAWRDDMATKDCNHLASYLINSVHTTNYTKLASENVQFVYNVYKQKDCIKTVGWQP